MATALQLAAGLSKVRLPATPCLLFLLKVPRRSHKIWIPSCSRLSIRCLSAHAQSQSDPRLFHQPPHNSNSNQWSTPQSASSDQQWNSATSSPNQQWNSQIQGANQGSPPNQSSNQWKPQNPNPNPNQWSPQNPNPGQQWRPQNPAFSQQWTPPSPNPNQWRSPQNPTPNQQWSIPKHNPIPNQQWSAQNQRPPPFDRRPPSPAPAPGAQPAAPPPAPVDLAALCREGKVKEAVEHMGQGALADPPTFFSLIAACSTPKLLDELKKIHDFFTRSPFHADLQINNKLIEMYSNWAAWQMPVACSTGCPRGASTPGI